MNGSSAVIEIKDVVVSYREKLALNGVTLTVHPGEFIGIIGPNGAGKTTLLTVIDGLGRIISGSVCVLGQDLTVTNRNSLRKRIGYVSQADNIDPRMPMSVHDVVMTGRYGRLGLLKSPGASDKAIINDTLESVGMSTLSGRPIGHLSGGEQQLDEPTASIDWRAKTEILELVKKIHDSRHLTTLFVTHELSSLPSACSRVLLMKNGLILGDGPTRDLLTDKNLSDLYDVSVAEVRKKREDVAF
jgi:ABC-type cobalamin/Fe3+-siderophores transport system ATPase subunit